MNVGCQRSGVSYFDLILLEGLHYLAKHFVLQFFLVLDLEYFGISFLFALINELFPSKDRK